MKKVFLGSIIICLLAVSLTSAISIDMFGSYKAKETVSAKVIGNVLEPIATGQIVLKKGHVETPLDFDVKKLGDDYYIWFITPSNSGEYTLWINNMYATVSGEAKIFDFAQNFTVTNETSDYYVKPGFIYSSSDFTMTAVLSEDVKKDITVDFPQSRDITLEPGENKISFSVSSVQYTGLYTMNFGKYKIPAYIITAKNAPAGFNASNFTQANETVNITEDSEGNYSLKFIPSKIKRTVYRGDEEIYLISVKNAGENDITDFSVIYNKMIFSISPKTPSRLDAGKELEFNLSVISINDYVNDKITFSANGEEFYLPIEINFTSNKSESNFIPAGDSGPNYYCEQLLGKICSTGERCNQATTPTKNGECCVNEKEPSAAACIPIIESSSGSSSWIGWVVAAVVLAGIGFLFYRYKKVHKEENPLEKKVGEIERENKFSP